MPARSPDDPAESITERLDRLTLRLGLKTRAELAARLGYSRTQIHGIEKGEVAPSRKFLSSLAFVEGEAGSEEVPRFRDEPDSVSLLLERMELDALCSTIQTTAGDIRKAGTIDPQNRYFLERCMEEINRRTAVAPNNTRYIK